MNGLVRVLLLLLLLELRGARKTVGEMLKEAPLDRGV